MKTTSKFAKTLLFFLLGAIISFSSPGFAGEVKIGLLLPITGKLARAGELELEGFLMAGEEINEGGGVGGNRIEFSIRDTQGKAEASRKAVQELAEQEGVLLIAGGCSSDAALAAAAEAENLKVPFVITTASADEITEQNREYVFRICPPSSEHYRSLITFLSEVVHVRSVAILCEDTPFGRYKMKNFFRVRKRLRLRLLRKDFYAPPALSFRPLISKMKARNPDLVYFISRGDDAALFVREAKEMGLNPKLFVGVEAGIGSPEFFEKAKDASEGLFFTSLWVPSIPYPGVKDFNERFLHRYGELPGYHGAQAYSAMQLVQDVLQRAEGLDRDQIKAALREADIESVYGPIRFVSYGKKSGQNRLPAVIAEWLNGRPETVWPREIASSRYVLPGRKPISR